MFKEQLGNDLHVAYFLKYSKHTLVSDHDLRTSVDIVQQDLWHVTDSGGLVVFLQLWTKFGLPCYCFSITVFIQTLNWDIEVKSLFCILSVRMGLNHSVLCKK